MFDPTDIIPVGDARFCGKEKRGGKIKMGKNRVRSGRGNDKRKSDNIIVKQIINKKEIKNMETFDNTEIPRSKGEFFKRPNGKFWLRLYPFKKSDGTTVTGKHIVSHWIDKVRYDCDGDGCEKCKEGIKKVYRKRIAIVAQKIGDEVQKDKKLILWDCPITVWQQIVDFSKENEGLQITGDKGITFCINFDDSKSPANKYSVSPSLANKTVLDFEKELLPFDQEAKVVEETGVTAEELDDDADLF